MTEASETVQSLTPADGMRWYVVHAYSGMEKAVERNIMERVGNAGMEAKFGRTLVPTEEVVELKNGQRRTTERKFFPRLRAGRNDHGRRDVALGQKHQQSHWL